MCTSTFQVVIYQNLGGWGITAPCMLEEIGVYVLYIHTKEIILMSSVYYLT